MFRPVPISQMLSKLLNKLYLLIITPYIPDFHGFTTDHVMEEDDYLIA